MITLDFEGTEVRFQETGVTPANPGLVHGALYQGKFYEEPFLRYIQSLQRRGTYLDIGAFVGTHTLFFALICGAERVHSFEPRPSVHARLAANVQLNDVADRVTLHRVALTDRPGEISLTFGGETSIVPGMRLDDLVSEPVAVIKIDVEGMEPVVLAGARRLLRRSRPVVFAEAGTAPEYEAVVRAMKQHGYVPTGRVWNATPTHEFFHLPWQRRVMESPLGSKARRLLPLGLRRRLRRFLPPPTERTGSV
jgi:FkbM family methyltransferase